MAALLVDAMNYRLNKPLQAMTKAHKFLNPIAPYQQNSYTLNPYITMFFFLLFLLPLLLLLLLLDYHYYHQ